MTDIELRDSVAGLAPEALEGFFVGWPSAPDPARHLQILQASSEVCVAWSDETVAGFVAAHGDGIFSAYISLLEVRPEFQRHGVGTALMRRMLDRLGDRYMVDLICDEDLLGFYERLGMSRYTGAIVRRPDALG